jgi:hypothetical protein
MHAGVRPLRETSYSTSLPGRCLSFGAYIFRAGALAGAILPQFSCTRGIDSSSSAAEVDADVSLLPTVWLKLPFSFSIQFWTGFQVFCNSMNAVYYFSFSCDAPRLFASAAD